MKFERDADGRTFYLVDESGEVVMRGEGTTACAAVSSWLTSLSTRPPPVEQAASTADTEPPTPPPEPKKKRKAPSKRSKR